jgi:hypothetical protein
MMPNECVIVSAREVNGGNGCGCGLCNVVWVWYRLHHERPRDGKDRNARVRDCESQSQTRHPYASQNVRICNMPSNVCEESYAAVQIYTPGKGWTYGAPLPFGRGGMGKCVCYYGKCYVFGGEVDTKTAPSTSKKVSSSRTVYSVDVYDIETNSWGQAQVCKAASRTFLSRSACLLSDAHTI